MNPKMALGNVGLMIPVMTRRKMPLIPRRSKGAAEVGRIYKKTMKLSRKREQAEAKARARMAVDEAAARAAAKAAHGAPGETCPVCGGAATDGHTHGADGEAA
jgi:DNA repair exonuclease SbcCD ATPase subunit